MGGRSAAKTLGAIALLMALSALPFLPGLRAPFFYDDLNTIVMNPAISSPRYADYFHKLDTFSADRARMFRPLVLSSLALNRQWFGDNMTGWHMTSLAAHLLAVAMVFLLVANLAGSRTVAFLAALLFGIHPSRVEPVIYISARAEVFASLFCLFSFLLFLKAASAKTRAKEFALGALSLAGFWLGLLSKDIAITLPAALTVERLVFKRLDKKSGAWLLVFWISAAAYFAVRKVLDLASFFPAARPRPVLDNLFLQGRVIAHYLRWIIYPVHPVVDAQFTPVSLAGVVLSAGLLCAMLAAGVLLLRKKPLWSFFIFFFFIALSPSSSVIPLVVQANIVRVYMPALMVFVILADAAVWISTRLKGNALGKAPVLAIVLALICLFALSANWAGKWNSPKRLWSASISAFPNHSRAHNNLGLLLERSGNYAQAEKEYLMAINAEPANASALDNFGRVLFARGEYSRAEFYFKKSLQLEPFNCITLINYGQMLLAVDRLAEAEELLNDAGPCPAYSRELAELKKRIELRGADNLRAP